MPRILRKTEFTSASMANCPADEIELPSMIESVLDRRAESNHFLDREQANRLGLRKTSSIGLVLGAVVLGVWILSARISTEKQYPNWQLVSEASEASADNAHQLVRVDRFGFSTLSPTLELTSADTNGAAMQQIRMALMRNDLVSASAALQAAQKLPSPSANPDVVLPIIDAGLAREIQEGRRELYQIELFDCCDEDGDVIEVLVNDKSFAAVPIMHQGTMVAIPLDRGHNIVTVRGVKDGGGGVTVSFRTSRGEYFARDMAVGEEHRMDVVVQ